MPVCSGVLCSPLMHGKPAAWHTSIIGKTSWKGANSFQEEGAFHCEEYFFLLSATSMRADGRISPILLDVVVPHGERTDLSVGSCRAQPTEGPRLVVRAGPLL